MDEQIYTFLKDSDDIKAEYMESSGFSKKMSNPDTSVYLEEGLSEAALTYVREAMAERGGALHLSDVYAENSDEARTILNTVGKLTRAHGSAVLDDTLRTQIQTVATRNGYSMKDTNVIDAGLFGHIANEAHATQVAVNRNPSGGLGWQEKNLHLAGSMGSSAMIAANMITLYTSAMLQSAKDWGLGNQGATYSDEYYAAKMNNWKKADGTTWWPLNNGAVSGTERTITLQPGTRIDRYGYEGGTFASPEGIPYSNRSLAPGTEIKPYNVYEVLQPVNVQAGEIAPWFDQSGGGTQFEFSQSITDMLGAEIIKRVTR